MDEIIERVARDTFAAANAVAVKRGRAKLRLVSNG